MGGSAPTRPRRVRAILPARLPQPSGERVDPGARRRRGQTRQRRAYCRRWLRPRSIDAARKRAADSGLADRVEFEVASASTFTGAYDLVCFFDCLHDMGDPAGACAHVREHLATDGTLMLIEPFAGDDLNDNLNPVGAAYYAFSTLLCTPSSLSQEVGAALGAQAGEAQLRDVVIGAGFKTLRRVAETPFNIVLEAKAA